MPDLRIRALVLAAGLATRLRPLTRARPKALLPVLGRPLIGETLGRLEAAGVEATAVNLHYLPDAIESELGERWGEMPLVYSREQEILGTLGALGPLRDFLGEADLIVLVNGDSLCDWPLRELVDRHLERGAFSTLLLSSSADPVDFGGVGIDAEGRVVAFPGAPEVGDVARHLVFAGCHVFGADLLRRVPEGNACIVADLYRPGLAQGLDLGSLVSDARWHDLGTPGRYLKAVLDTLERRGAGPRDSHLGDGVEVAPGARVLGCVLEPGARVQEGAVCEQCLILPGAVVGKGAYLRRCIVGDGVQVPPGKELSGAMVTPAAWDTGSGSRSGGDRTLTPFAG
jgi:NDP-sugar pyrophosphorylase family protein